MIRKNDEITPHAFLQVIMHQNIVGGMSHSPHFLYKVCHDLRPILDGLGITTLQSRAPDRKGPPSLVNEWSKFWLPPCRGVGQKKEPLHQVIYKFFSLCLLVMVHQESLCSCSCKTASPCKGQKAKKQLHSSINPNSQEDRVTFGWEHPQGRAVRLLNIAPSTKVVYRKLPLLEGSMLAVVSH